MIRQSAVAADGIAIVAISAKSPAFKVMVRPPSWILDAKAKAEGTSTCLFRLTQPFVAFNPLTPR